MHDLAEHLIHSLVEYLEEMDEFEEDQGMWSEVPPHPASHLLDKLHYLVLNKRISLQQALRVCGLYLKCKEDQFSVPEELTPVMMQVKLLSLDEGRMVEQ